MTSFQRVSLQVPGYLLHRRWVEKERVEGEEERVRGETTR